MSVWLFKFYSWNIPRRKQINKTMWRWINARFLAKILPWPRIFSEATFLRSCWTGRHWRRDASGCCRPRLGGSLSCWQIQWPCHSSPPKYNSLEKSREAVLRRPFLWCPADAERNWDISDSAWSSGSEQVIKTCYFEAETCFWFEITREINKRDCFAVFLRN